MGLKTTQQYGKLQQLSQCLMLVVLRQMVNEPIQL